jgi:hypothetical protein
VFGGDEHGAHKGFPVYKLAISWATPLHRTGQIQGRRQRVGHGGRASEDGPDAARGAGGSLDANRDTGRPEEKRPGASAAGAVGPCVRPRWRLGTRPTRLRLANAYQAGTSTLTAYAPIQMAPLNNGKTGITKYGHHNLGGTDCFNDGPSGTERALGCREAGGRVRQGRSGLSLGLQAAVPDATTPGGELQEPLRSGGRRPAPSTLS